MGRSRYSGGAKYANGNYKQQQKDYNKTEHGLKIRINANKLNRKLGTYGNRDGLDSAHEAGSTTKGKTQSPKINRASRGKPKGGKAK